jgi:hypothetical protein
MCTVAGRHPSARHVDEFDSPEACELSRHDLASDAVVVRRSIPTRSDGPALRRNIVGVMRALHDGQ